MKDQPTDRTGPDGHGNPEGHVPANEHYGRCIGADTHILRLAQIHLAPVSADGVPSHAIEGKHEELNHGAHGKGGMGKQWKKKNS
jgi:hypothetical protein